MPAAPAVDECLGAGALVRVRYCGAAVRAELREEDADCPWPRLVVDAEPEPAVRRPEEDVARLE